MSVNEIFRLLQPGLMSEEEIKEELVHRGMKMKDVRSMTKNEMVEMYLHFFMPLPQRKSRNTSRGKETNSMIIGENVLEESGSNYLSSSLQIGFSSSTSSVSNSSILGKRGGDRLKPPPEKSHISSKKILLSQSVSSFDDSRERIVIKDRSKERRDSKEEEKTASGGRLNVHENTNLKRCATSNTNTKSDESPPLKKTKQRIQWP